MIVKKRALVSLALVLVGAVIWARHKAWQKLEENFRQQIIVSSARSPLYVPLINERRDRFEDLGKYQTNELASFLFDVHLERSDKVGLHSENTFRCSVDGTASSGDIGFYLGVEQDEGVIVESFDPTIMGYRWEKFRISPKSCRILKKRLRAKFGNNPHGAKIPPP